MSTGNSEILDFGAPRPPAPPSAADGGDNGGNDGGRSRSALAAVAVIVAVLLLAGGAFAAYRLGVFGAAGDQPSTVVPASAFAYASVDFNPSAKEKLGAYQLAKKFPSAKVTSKDAVKDSLLRSLFEDAPGVDYDRDIKPWIGDRAAAAALPAPGTKDGVTPLVVVGYTDKEQAKTGLAKVEKAMGSPMSYAFKGDYVLLSDNQKELDAAVAAKSTLDGDTTFSHDIDALGGDQFARAWLDGKGLAAALPASAADELPPGFADRLSGTMAVGAHATGDYLEVAGKTFGFAPAADLTAHKVALAGTFPADANVAVELTGLGDSLTKTWDSFKGDDPFGIDREARGLGIHLPADLLNVFGSDFALAVRADKEFEVAVNARTPDPDKSRQVLSSLLPLAGADGQDVTLDATDDGYAAATNPDWAKQGTDGTGTLADSDVFRSAVPQAKDSDAFAFVDIASVAKAFDAADDKDLAPLQAFGLSGTTDGDHGEFTLRLTLK